MCRARTFSNTATATTKQAQIASLNCSNCTNVIQKKKRRKSYKIFATKIIHELRRSAHTHRAHLYTFDI